MHISSLDQSLWCWEMISQKIGDDSIAWEKVQQTMKSSVEFQKKNYIVGEKISLL